MAPRTARAIAMLALVVLAVSPPQGALARRAQERSQQMVPSRESEEDLAADELSECPEIKHFLKILSKGSTDQERIRCAREAVAAAVQRLESSGSADCTAIRRVLAQVIRDEGQSGMVRCHFREQITLLLNRLNGAEAEREVLRGQGYRRGRRPRGREGRDSVEEAALRHGGAYRGEPTAFSFSGPGGGTDAPGAESGAAVAAAGAEGHRRLVVAAAAGAATTLLLGGLVLCFVAPAMCGRRERGGGGETESSADPAVGEGAVQQQQQLQRQQQQPPAQKCGAPSGGDKSSVGRLPVPRSGLPLSVVPETLLSPRPGPSVSVISDTALSHGSGEGEGDTSCDLGDRGADDAVQVSPEKRGVWTGGEFLNYQSEHLYDRNFDLVNGSLQGPTRRPPEDRRRDHPRTDGGGPPRPQHPRTSAKARSSG